MQKVLKTLANQVKQNRILLAAAKQDAEKLISDIPDPAIRAKMSDIMEQAKSGKMTGVQVAEAIKNI